jgi:hypothetical protein
MNKMKSEYNSLNADQILEIMVEALFDYGLLEEVEEIFGNSPDEHLRIGTVLLSTAMKRALEITEEKSDLEYAQWLDQETRRPMAVKASDLTLEQRIKVLSALCFSLYASAQPMLTERLSSRLVSALVLADAGIPMQDTEAIQWLRDVLKEDSNG